MTVQTISTLKANMSGNTPGGITTQDMHDIVDTLAARSNQDVIEKTTNYTVSLEDNQRKIVFNSAVDVNLSLPNNLPANWECSVVQLGTGVVIINVTNGVVLSRLGHMQTAGRYSMIWLFCLSNTGSSPRIILTGDSAVMPSSPVGFDAFSSGFSSGFR